MPMVLLLLASAILAAERVLVRSHHGGVLVSRGGGEAALDSRSYATLLLRRSAGKEVRLEDAFSAAALSGRSGKPVFAPYSPGDRLSLLEVALYAPNTYKIRSGETCLEKVLDRGVAWAPCSTSRSQLWNMSFPGPMGEKLISVMDSVADEIERWSSSLGRAAIQA